MALERPGEDHRRQRLVELHRRHRGERRHLPAHVGDLERRGAVADVEADRQARRRGRRPQRLPGGVGDAKLERADDRAAVAVRGAALELGDRRRRGVRRQHRQHAEAVAIVRVELVGPVVVGAQTGRLELLVLDRQAEQRRAVDHRGAQPIAVHVLQPQRRRAGAKAVVGDAGARRRVVVAEHLETARTEHRPVAHPPLVLALRDDARPALLQRARQPRRPQIDGQRPEIEMVVAGIERVHRPILHVGQ